MIYWTSMYLILSDRMLVKLTLNTMNMVNYIRLHYHYHQLQALNELIKELHQ